MTTTATPDRGYLHLLQHLRQIQSNLSSETILSATSHYLANSPVSNPIPTPLVASFIVSPLWNTLDVNLLLSIGSSFRKSVHLKYHAVRDENKGLFGGSISRHLSDWLKCVLEGLKGRDAPNGRLLRMAACGGLLAGMNDVKSQVTVTVGRKVEEELVLAFSEVLQEASAKPVSDDDDSWEKEFLPRTEDSHRKLNASIFLAAHYFSFVSDEVFSALKLPVVIGLCLSTVQSAFRSGHFLQPTSPNSIDVLKVTESDAFLNIAPVCKLLSRSVVLYADNTRRWRRRRVWNALGEVTRTLEAITAQVNHDWRTLPLALLSPESKHESSSGHAAEDVWLILKTLLFSLVMIHQSVLDTMLYLPDSARHSVNSSKGKQTEGESASAARLSSVMLKSLLNLSFVVSEFGGVTISHAGDGGPGFPELKKAFYLSVDLLASDEDESEIFVRSVFNEVQKITGSDAPQLFIRTTVSLALICVEQLLPVISPHYLHEYVLPLCEPYLEDSSARETFESAHSVLLGIFAAHSKKATNIRGSTEVEEATLPRRLVPGYIKSLVRNVEDGKLTTDQFVLAYSALVRGAGTQKMDDTTTAGGEDALAWLCVEALLECLHSGDQESQTSGAGGSSSEKRIRIRLTLIALISNVSLALLPRILDEVGEVLELVRVTRERDMLLKATFEEIMERLGDGEKETAMRWWFRLGEKESLADRDHELA